MAYRSLKGEYLMLIGFIQLFLAYLFLNTGMEKARHPAHAYQTVRRMMPALSAVAKPLGIVTIMAELATSASLLIRPLALVGLVVSIFLLSAFLVVLVSSLSSDGPAASCGCGPKMSRADGTAIARNVLLIIIAAAGLWLRSSGANPLTEWPSLIHEMFASLIVLSLFVPEVYAWAVLKNRLASNSRAIELLLQAQPQTTEGASFTA